jgi:CubicO group peptidase (beta-lactamase class C family)
MEATTLLASDFADHPQAASPHTLVKGVMAPIPVPRIDNLAPAGSIGSSVQDMTRWLRFQLANGQWGGKQLLPAAALQLTRTPQSIMGLDPRDRQPTHFYLYGLGLAINDRAGRLVYSHTGGVNGFFSAVLFVPEEQLGIVVLTNNDQNNFYQNLTDQIRDAFLGLPFRHYSEASYQQYAAYRLAQQSREDSLRALVARGYPASLPLEAYAGVYENPVYGAIELKKDKEQLVIHFSHHPDLTGALQHLTDDRFLCTYSQPVFGVQEIPFEVDDGGVKALTLRVDDFVEFTPYVFTKQ